MNNKPTWTVRNGVTATECASFPFAVQQMIKIIRKTLASGGSYDRAKSGFQIVGPPNGKGEPMIYNYDKAIQLAKAMGIIDQEGNFDKKAAFGKKSK